MNTKNKFAIQPSVICCDLCNLETEVKALKKAGVQSLHIDVLDGAFSPSLPVGLDTFIQLSKKIDLPFDVHIMSNNNEWFIDECLKMKPERICFQCEGEKHIEAMLSKIKAAGVKAGVAFAPSTPISQIGYAINDCDFVLLMRIEPGYASHKGIDAYSYMNQKVIDTRAILDQGKKNRDIVIDGRVSFDVIEDLTKLGATCFVCGSKSIFISKDYKKNVKEAKERYNKVLG